MDQLAQSTSLELRFQRLECDLVFSNGWAKCRRCKKEFKAPHGRARSHCAIEPPLPTSGPGSWTKRILERFGIVATHGCSCNKMAKKMNEQGGWWCLTSGRSEILGVMKAEAEKRKLTWRPACVNVLIFLAVLLSWIETAILWDTGIQDTKRK